MGALQFRHTKSGRMVTGRFGDSSRRRTRAATRRHADRTGSLYQRAGKRWLDALGALAGLTVTSPILLLCAVAIWVDSRGPIFFRQTRVGLHGATFRIFKFRTMSLGADRLGSRLTAAGDARITRIGKILRKTKLDEIPQLLNVLAGQMSLVGPRPEVPEYTARYTPAESKVLDVKPGMTGPASVAYIDEEGLLASCSDKESFYVNTVMRQKLVIDLVYRGQVSLTGDLRLIFQTATTLLARHLSRRNVESTAWVFEADHGHSKAKAA